MCSLNGEPECERREYYVTQPGTRANQFETEPVKYSPYFQEDHESVSARGANWSELLSCLTSPLMRLGFLLQLLAMIFGFATYYGHGGDGVFTFDLFSSPEPLRSSESYSTIMILIESMFLLGCIMVSTFQVYIADNSKVSRGFRAGSKMLSSAALLDTFVVGLRLMQYIYAHKFLGNRWWLKYLQSNADRCLYLSGTLIHAISLILYGLSVFYMEAYHDEGTYEEWSYLILGLFSITGLFEFIMVFTGFGSFFTVLHVLALLATVVWAFSFEPLLHFHSPVFHDRDLNADIYNAKGLYEPEDDAALENYTPEYQEV